MAQICLWKESPGEVQDSSYKYQRQSCEQRSFIPSILGGQALNREEGTAQMDKERFKGHTAAHRLLHLTVAAACAHTEHPCLGRTDQTPASLRVQGLPLLISVISLQSHKSIYFYRPLGIFRGSKIV